MQVNYCDLCSSPLKEGSFFLLYISEPRGSNFNEMEEYMEYRKKVERGVKEICPACKHIFDRMFELRLAKLSELAGEITNTYNLPSKKNPKERGNGKKENK
jgi:hypothetical protein